MKDQSSNTELEGCYNTVAVLEKNLEQKSLDLTYQIMYNSLCMVIAVVGTFIFMKIDKSRLFRRTK